MKTAIFSGTFDPFTLGHYEIVVKAGQIFDKVFVAVAESTGKSGSSRLSDRVKIARASIADLAFAEVISFSGALHSFAAALKVRHIIRGLRTAADFDYEKDLLSVYKSQSANLEAVYFVSQPAHSHISSSAVRELTRLGCQIDNYVCAAAIPAITNLYKD